MHKLSCKVDKHILRYNMFFHRGPARPPPALRFSKKTGPVRLKKIMSGVLILFMCPK